MMEASIVDYITAGSAVLALPISILSYRLSRRLRKEQGQSLLLLDMMQINSSLYVSVYNAGNTFAYDVQITVPGPFVNCFSNLKLIQPGAVYRYPLLQSRETGEYPTEATFSISYRDRYTKGKPMQKIYSFKLSDYSKYEITLNSELGVFDISKSY